LEQKIISEQKYTPRQNRGLTKKWLKPKKFAGPGKNEKVTKSPSPTKKNIQIILNLQDPG